MQLKRICVFCGSSMGARSSYKSAAQTLGTLLAHQGIELVYGGGNVGLMGVIADATLAAGGHVIGVIPEALVAKEVAHSGLSHLHVVTSMHDRKALMADLSDGFIALPGGFGTFEEFCEVLTWTQLNIHQKPTGLLNIDGYYDALIALFDHATQEQFIKPVHRSLVLQSEDPQMLLHQLAGYEPKSVDKWIGNNLQP